MPVIAGLGQACLATAVSPGPGTHSSCSVGTCRAQPLSGVRSGSWSIRLFGEKSSQSALLFLFSLFLSVIVLLAQAVQALRRSHASGSDYLHYYGIILCCGHCIVEPLVPIILLRGGPKPAFEVSPSTSRTGSWFTGWDTRALLVVISRLCPRWPLDGAQTVWGGALHPGFQSRAAGKQRIPERLTCLL